MIGLISNSNLSSISYFAKTLYAEADSTLGSVRETLQDHTSGIGIYIHYSLRHTDFRAESEVSYSKEEKWISSCVLLLQRTHI